MSKSIRVRKNRRSWERHGWTAGPNSMIRDPELPWELRGVWMWLASHTETFDLTGDALWKAGPAGRDKCYQFLRDLERFGYLTRHHELGEDGQPVLVYDLHPKPVPEEQRTYRPSKAKPRKNPLAKQNARSERIPDRAGKPSSEGIPDSAGKRSDQGIPETGGEGRTPDGPVPDRSGVPYKEEKTIQEDHSLSPSVGTSPTEVQPEREGEKESASQTENRAPAEWALDLIDELDFGRHRRPTERERDELARLVEAAHTDRGLPKLEIRRYCRIKVNAATKSAVAYLLGGLQPDNLPAPPRKKPAAAQKPASTGDQPRTPSSTPQERSEGESYEDARRRIQETLNNLKSKRKSVLEPAPERGLDAFGSALGSTLQEVMGR